MGTRNLTMVINQAGETKVAQYGQWDGYPEGNGVDILDFLSSKDNLKKLRESIGKVRFLDIDGKDKEFIDLFNSNAEKEKLTKEQNDWHKNFVSRDIGADILKNIINSNDAEVLLIDKSKFANDTVFCEWIWIVDLNKNKLIARRDFQNDWSKEFDLDNLPTKADFLNAFKEEEEE